MSHSGLHHVTAIAGLAARNRDFHNRVLGQRLVKRTVNFDDPGTYHLYYGNAAGAPGTILTFFPWEHVASGRLGVGETSETAFRVPKTSIGWWAQRFVEHGVAHDAPAHVFGETVLPFRDPDGMNLALVGVAGAEAELAWAADDIPAAHAIRGFHGVTLMVARAEGTAAVLTDVFGFRGTSREGSLIRFSADAAVVGRHVTLRVVGDFLPGRPGGGSVHHVAFRAVDDAAQAAMVERLRGHGIAATEQKDRTYFRSVYFREPGGVLFEIATDVPGFAVDEAPDALGQALELPPQHETRRAAIERVLPSLDDTTPKAV